MFVPRKRTNQHAHEDLDSNTARQAQFPVRLHNLAQCVVSQRVLDATRLGFAIRAQAVWPVMGDPATVWLYGASQHFANTP